MGFFGIVKIVSAIDSRERPVNTCLVFVVTRTKLGEGSFSVWGNDWVEVGAKARPSILSDRCVCLAFPANGNGLGFVILEQIKLFE